MNNISFFKALLMKELDEKELSKKQKDIADEAEPFDKITGADFKALQAKKKVKKEVDTPSTPSTYSGKPGIPGLGPIVGMKEGGDHEVGMANNSLESIIKSAMELKMKLGNDERDIPGWIQDHITNAENYIDQAAQGFHELHGGEHDMDELPDGTEEDYIQEGISIDIPEDTDYKEFAVAVANILKNDYGTHNYEPFISALSSELSKEEEPVEELSLESMMEDLFEAKKKKPSAGLSKKQKSAIAKKAKAGKDVGKKGKGFEKVAKAAAEKYGSKERGQKVAAAAMWKSAAKKSLKEEASDWEPGFEWMDELPMKYGNWTIDTVEDSVGFGFDDQPIVWYYKGDENGYRVVYTPNDYYATEIMLYTPGQNMYDRDEKPIELQSIELGDETEDFSFEKYVKYGAKAIAKAEQIIQKAGK